MYLYTGDRICLPKDICIQLERLLLNAVLNLAVNMLRFALRRLEKWLTITEKEDTDLEREGITDD